MHFQSILIAVFAMFCVAANAIPMRSCVDYSAKIPNVKVALCEAAQLQDMQVRTVQGRPIWGKEIVSDPARLRILVLGGIHGDEMSSSSLVFHWIALAKKPSTGLPAQIHWRFIPTLNPDGLFARPAKRVNARGVDLNRNFPTPNWAKEASTYWVTRTQRDPRRWPGNKPLSEPESRFLQDQMDHFKPNLIVSVHAPLGVLDFDGPTAPPAKIGRLYLDQVGIYPGSLGNYGGIHKGVPVVTIELPHAAKTPNEAEMRRMWGDLLRWVGSKLEPEPEPGVTTAARNP